MGLKSPEQKNHRNRYLAQSQEEAKQKYFLGEIYIKYTQVTYDYGYITRFSDQHGAL